MSLGAFTYVPWPLQLPVYLVVLTLCSPSDDHDHLHSLLQLPVYVAALTRHVIFFSLSGVSGVLPQPDLSIACNHQCVCLH